MEKRKGRGLKGVYIVGLQLKGLEFIGRGCKLYISLSICPTDEPSFGILEQTLLGLVPDNRLTREAP